MRPREQASVNEGAHSGRIQYLDVLRVLSMLSVVFLHTAAGTLRANYGSLTWHFANLLTSFMSASVPVFFMISGALLLQSRRTLSVKYTLGKRLPRVLVPFLVWSLVAVGYFLLVHRGPDGSLDWAMAVEKLKNLPARPTAVHLWFMYALIPLYILSPFIKKLIDSLGRDLVIYLLAIWVIFSSLLPTVTTFLPVAYRPLVVLDSRYNLSIMAGYAGYFVVGYYLMRMRTPIPRKILILVVVVDTICITAGTWWKTTSLGVYAEGFKTYTGLFVLVLSCALFLLFKELVSERRLRGVVGPAVRFLAPLAFGVYLIHNLVVDYMARLVPWFPASSVPILIASYVVVLAISMAFIAVASQIWPLRYILAGQGSGRSSKR